VARLDRVVVTQDDRTLDAVLKLADVAGPRIGLQLVERGRRQMQLLVQIARELLDEMARQRRNVTRTFAQRRDVDRKHGQPKKQIFAELLRGDRRLQLAVRCGNDADVDVERLRAADTLEPLFLERAENLCLQPERQVPDLVEKQRAPVREFKPPGLPGGGPCERALFVSEQLRLEQRFGNGRAVDGDKRAFRSAAEGVQGAGEQLFAGAALPLQQHGRVGAGRTMQLLRHLAQLGIVSNDARSAAALGEFLLEQEVIGQHPALGNRALHHQQQVIRVHGLGEKVHGPFLHRRHRILDAAIRRHHHDGQLRIELRGGAQNTKAVAFGQLQVGQDDHRARLLHPLDGRWLVHRLDDRVALCLERVPQHRSQRVFVFDEKNWRSGQLEAP
jgi:hypothetical protein